jgi:alkylation response protein AidB-like acyl-CoA dehydrogenase
MNLELDEQMQMLRDAVERYLHKEHGFERRCKMRGAHDFIAFWQKLQGDLGIAAAAYPEAMGGMDGGPVANMVVAKALGASLAVTPFIDNHVIAASIAIGVGRPELAKDIANGIRLAACALEEHGTRGDISHTATSAERSVSGWTLHGTKVAIRFAASADLILVPAQTQDGKIALFGIAADQLAGCLKSYRLIDDCPAADIILDGFPVEQDALWTEDIATIESAIDLGTAALCAEAAGLARVLFDDTVEFARQRKQFGQAIGAFQALQHRMVDMMMLVEQVDAAAMLAALKTDQPAAISAAKATVGEALRKIGQEAVQLHGAMGMTEELRVGHYFKRATALENRLGNSDMHIRRYARLQRAG